jgi:hypothetical protein
MPSMSLPKRLKEHRAKTAADLHDMLYLLATLCLVMLWR